MRNRGTNQFFAMVILFTMMFTMMMPMGRAYAATITVDSAEDSVVQGNTLQMTTTYSSSVTWSVAPLVGGTAKIDATTGLLTGGTGIGTVTVIATATDGSAVGTKTITVTAAPVAVTGITVTSAGNASTIVNAGTLQMSATVLPANATDKTVNWSVVPGTGSATINETGLLTGGAVLGTVTVIATAKDGSGISGTKPITVIAPVSVSSISVNSAGGASTVLKNKTLALNATILPTGATNKSITWSIVPLAGVATINTTGLLTGTGVGTVTVRASAKDGSGIFGEKVITVTEPVTSITVTDAGAGTVVNGGTLQMGTDISPATATDKTVTWSIVPTAGVATITAGGLLTGTGVGTVTVKATAHDGSGITDTKVVTVTSAFVEVTGITVTGAGTVVNGGTLQMGKTVLPETATDKTVKWSVAPGTGTASIDADTGLLTGTGVGTVTVTATANDGSGIKNDKIVTVTTAPVLVTDITVATTTGADTVAHHETLQMSATISPTNATNPDVTWSVTPLVGGGGTITPTGLLTGTGVGTVTVTATANDGSNIIKTKVITVEAVKVTGVTVTDTGASKVVNGQTLQMNVDISPTTATNQSVTWSVAPLVGGAATITPTGLLTGKGVGTVTVKATANDGSGIIGAKTVTVTETPVKVTSIIVTDKGAGKVVNGGTLNMSATVLPETATNPSVTWSVATLVGGSATIDPTTGVLKGTGVGTVTVKATANDTADDLIKVYGTKDITVLAVTVESIKVTGAENAITVKNGGTLQMNAEVFPATATEKSVIWSVEPEPAPGKGTATITANGLLTGTGVGTVTVKATAIDGTATIGTKEITVTAESIAVTSIEVTGEDGVSNVAKDGTLQMRAAVLPATATNLSVTWSRVNKTGTAEINATTGVLTGVRVGTVTVIATANDGSKITGSKDIMVNVPFAITTPVLPDSSTVGVPVPITFSSFGTKKGYVWNWSGIKLEEQDTTTAGTSTDIEYTHTLDEEDDMTITPTIMLNFGKTYTLTIPAGAVVDSTLNPNLAFSFVQVKPTSGVSIVAVDLVANDSSVSVDKVITLTTNVPSTVDSNFPITLETAGTIVTLAYTYDNNNIIVVPTEMLQGGTTYTLKIPAGCLKDSTAATNEASSISFTTAYNLSDLINNVYYPVNLNTLMSQYSPRGLNVNVPKRYLTKIDIAYSMVSTNPLTNVDITAEAEVAKINVQFGASGPTYQAIKGTTSWNTGYEGALTTLDGAGQSVGQDIIFEALDQYGRLLERKTYIKLLEKGNKLDLSSTKKLSVTKTFADLILSSGKLLTDILKQYSLDELSLSVGS